jgi:hypothetical protein
LQINPFHVAEKLFFKVKKPARKFEREAIKTLGDIYLKQRIHYPEADMFQSEKWALYTNMPYPHKLPGN